MSGGEEGALNGPSIMPGGSKESYASLGPMLEKISAKAPDGSPCVTHCGPDGAGHFVKMVHDGIEYADMQLIGEAYQLLREVAGYSPAQIADIFRTWNTGRLDSYLIEITAEVLSHVDAATGKPFVDVVQDRAEQKGTGRWTVQIALDLGVPVCPASRRRSSPARCPGTPICAPPPGSSRAPRRSRSGTPRRRPSRTGWSRRCTPRRSCPTQGFHEISAGSDQYDWDIDLGAVSAIWRGGCIMGRRRSSTGSAPRTTPGPICRACCPTRRSRRNSGGAGRLA